MVVYRGYSIKFAHWEERQSFVVNEDRKTVFIQAARDLERAVRDLQIGRGPRRSNRLWWIIHADKTYGEEGWTYVYEGEIDWPTAQTLYGFPEQPVENPLAFDPVSGQPIMYYTGGPDYREKNPGLTWLYNPWTAQQRPDYALVNDPLGKLMTPEDKYDLREQGRK